MEITTQNQTLTHDEVLTQHTCLSRNTKSGSDGLQRVAVNLRRQRGFVLDFDVQKIRDMIIYCYAYEVSLRGRKSESHYDLSTAALKVAQMLAGMGSCFGAIILGNVGNGKTTFMKAIQRCINWFVYKGQLTYGTGLRIVSAKDIHCNGETDREKFKQMCQEELLGIDDLGSEPREEMYYGRPTTPVTDLLEYRYSRQLVTFVTTNISPSQIKDKYGERISDRCHEMFLPIVFKNPSFR